MHGRDHIILLLTCFFMFPSVLKFLKMIGNDESLDKQIDANSLLQFSLSLDFAFYILRELY